MKNLLDFYNYGITSTTIENERNAFPIQEKYVKYRNINEFLVPSIIKIENLSEEKLKIEIKNYIRKNPLLRSVLFSKNGELSVKIYEYNDNLVIPEYKIDNLDELEKLICESSKILKSRNILNEVLYNIVIVKHKTSLFLVTIFNHIISDGYFGILEDHKEIHNFSNFEEYIDNLEVDSDLTFDEYIRLKEQLYNDYTIDENLTDNAIIETRFLLNNRKVSFEESLANLLARELLKIFPEYKSLPLCLLVNGRNFSNIKGFNQFGDFHDEIQLIITKDSNNFCKELHSFISKKYKNSKKYSNFLKTCSSSSVEQMEPINVLITYFHQGAHEQIQYKKYLKKNKNHLLSIKVCIYPNLSQLEISFLYTPQLKEKINKLKLNLRDSLL